VKSYSGGVRHDYKDSPVDPEIRQQSHWPWFAVGLVLPLLAVTVLFPSPKSDNAPPPRKPEAVAGQPVAVAVPEQTEPLVAKLLAPPPPEPDTLDLVIQRGDNLDTLFRHNRLSLSDLHAMSMLADAGRYLRMLRPGDEIRITHDGEKVIGFERALDDFNTLFIGRSQDGFVSNVVARDVEVRTANAHGVINSSLFEAGVEAGISDRITMNMAGIFQWDIDFLQDVRIGDEFTVIYEEIWRDGVRVKDGDVIAAEFVNRGSAYRAARYIDSTGRSDYFTPEGRSVRKAFVRAPVDFTRISSNFDPRRKHPILNTIRAHRGVDYAAPIGTPVKAAGDGKVIFRGQKNGYGNTIVLQHGGNITTLYGHMSRFANNKVGSRVVQGQIIGYVGKSGLATGPHLHYEYQVNGVHRNPRTVKLPPADPVPAEYWEDFQARTATLWHQLDLYEKARVATAAN
jgi:murein DD-endopeptidase MepM/ murein hydrolase activator NlpD